MITQDISNLFLAKSRFRTRITVFILIFTLIPTFLIIMATQYYTERILINGYLDNYLKNVHNDIESNINILLYQVNITALSIIGDNEIYSAVMDSDLSDSQKSSKIKDCLSKLLANNELLGDVIIITKDGQEYRYADKSRLIEEPGSEFIHQLTDSRLTISPKVKKDINGESYILFGKQFQYFHTGYKLGYLVLYLKESVLRSTYKDSIFEQSDFFILIDNYIISHRDTSQIGSLLYAPNLQETKGNKILRDGNTACVVSKHTLNIPLASKWEIISVISYNRLYNAVATIYKYVWSILLILITVILFLAFYLSKRIVNPLIQLTNKMTSFGSGNTDISLFKENKNELWHLEESFNTLVLQIRELLHKNNEEKEKQRISELKALQAQINPHFINNALDAISWIAKLRKQTEIEQLVFSLASFFRISLHKGESMITVSEELEHIKSYMTIEKMRFPNKFNIEFCVDEDILDCKMIKIILQPLIENAIKHGFNGKQGTGVIRILGYQIDNDLRFEVIDDGIGFDTEILTSDPPILDENKSGGYGIYNIQERLTLEYGQGYGLSYTSRPGMGTRVEVRLKKLY